MIPKRLVDEFFNSIDANGMENLSSRVRENKICHASSRTPLPEQYLVGSLYEMHYEYCHSLGINSKVKRDNN
ncbi:hypothetical protein BH23THE1_BH23THE1_15560 [soil metagenome]